MRPVAELRILEVGEFAWVKDVLPEQTTYFSTAFGVSRNDPEGGSFDVSLRTFGRLLKAVSDPDLSLIVCSTRNYSPWHWRWLSRALFDRRTLQGRSALVRAFGPQALRLHTTAPIAIIDNGDLPVINMSNMFLLKKCHFYFKRELPVDHWRVFLKTAHPDLPTPRFRRAKRYNELVSKLRPLSIGIPAEKQAMLPVTADVKKTDVFFSGLISGSSTVRTSGIQELMALRDQGITIDIPERRLPSEEFYRRCSESWLTWSPEGLGWDCFRHYEAPACGSVPVINRPTILRHRPLLDGIHAFYYEPEPGGLVRTIVTALSDKPRLWAMAQAAKTHVMTHHTLAAIIHHVIETTLGRTERCGGIS